MQNSIEGEPPRPEETPEGDQDKIVNYLRRDIDLDRQRVKRDKRTGRFRTTDNGRAPSTHEFRGDQKGIWKKWKMEKTPEAKLTVFRDIYKKKIEAALRVGNMDMLKRTMRKSPKTNLGITREQAVAELVRDNHPEVGAGVTVSFLFEVTNNFIIAKGQSGSTLLGLPVAVRAFYEPLDPTVVNMIHCPTTGGDHIVLCVAPAEISEDALNGELCRLTNRLVPENKKVQKGLVPSKNGKYQKYTKEDWRRTFAASSPNKNGLESKLARKARAEANRAYLVERGRQRRAEKQRKKELELARALRESNLDNFVGQSMGYGVYCYRLLRNNDGTYSLEDFEKYSGESPETCALAASFTNEDVAEGRLNIRFPNY